MTHGPDESPRRDQPEAQPEEGQHPELEPVEDLVAGVPDDVEEAEESLEPTADFQPPEPMEPMESLAPVELAETAPESPLAEVPTDAEGSTEPGLADTAAFESFDSQVSDVLQPSEGESETAEVAGEGVGGPSSGDLLAAVADTISEPEALAEEAEKAEEEEEAEKGGGVLAWIGETSVYNVLLFIALVALAIGSYGLYLELERYKFDFKAEAAKQPVAAAAGLQAEPSTTAVA